MGNNSQGINNQNYGTRVQEQGRQEFVLQQYGGKVVVDKINRLVFVDVRISSNEAEEFQELIQERKGLDHRNLAKMLHVEQIKYEGSFCAPLQRRYRLVYQLYVFSLYNEIENCCKARRPIPEHEIIRIFQQVTQCLMYLHSKQTSHGDLKVKSIFLAKDRTVKLVDSFLLKRGKTAYQIVLEDSNSMSLLAPEQLQLLRFKIFDSLQNIEEKQIFMLGMCMIQMTTILESMKCYNLQQLKIRDEFFIFMMEQIQSCGYSFDLSNLIMSCVHKNPGKRPRLNKVMEAFGYIKQNRRQMMK